MPEVIDAPTPNEVDAFSSRAPSGRQTNMVATMRAMASNLLDRARLRSRTGSTFEGQRDMYHALGYKRDLQPADYYWRYRRNSVAARVVEAYPRGTWRGTTVELLENEDPNDHTPFEKDWLKQQKRLKIWPTLMKADVMAGMGRYSVVFLGAPGSPEKELPNSVKPENLLFLSVYSEENAKIKKYEDRTSSERFGLPLLYTLTFLNPNGGKQQSFDAHWSRIIHVADGSLTQPMFGFPRLERCWNLLDDLEKITGSGAEAFWLRSHQGYLFDLDPEIELLPENERKLADEVEEFINGFRRDVRTRGMKVTTLGSDVAEISGNVASVISQISSGSDIPQRLLMGSEQGQLASEQDRVNWAERVNDRRTHFAQPVVVEQIANRFIKYGIVASPNVEDEWFTKWPGVFDLSPGERVKLAAGVADVCQKYKKTVITVNELRWMYFDKDPLKPEEIEDIGAKPDTQPNDSGLSGGSPENDPSSQTPLKT